MHVEILPPEGTVKYLEQMITFVDQETTEVQHRIRCAWSAFARHRQELNIQILPATTPITPIRRCCYTNNYVRCRNMGTTTEQAKNPPHYPAQNAPTPHPDKKENTKI